MFDIFVENYMQHCHVLVYGYAILEMSLQISIKGSHI